MELDEPLRWRLLRRVHMYWFTTSVLRTKRNLSSPRSKTNGGSANALSDDLGTPNGAALLARQVLSIVRGRLDVLVLNAGISKSARIADYTVEDFDNLFATNVRSPFFLVQQLLPVLGKPEKPSKAALLSRTSAQRIPSSARSFNREYSAASTRIAT